MKKNSIKLLAVWLFFHLISLTGQAQVTIAGPSCVTSGVFYLYSIAGKYDSSTTAKICVVGGKIDSAGLSCLQGKWQSFVKVAWDDNNKAGTISLNSSIGNSVYKIRISKALFPGNLDSASLVQVTDYTKNPKLIKCSVATGGSCSPIYFYQWQQSLDNMAWVDIPGASQQNFGFTHPQNTTTYYRRKVKAQGSDEEAYTVAALVIIQPLQRP
jgi:hypothetical protein